MSEKIQHEKTQSVRGTQDFISDSALLYRSIENLAWKIAKIYGYEEIQTPIFEFSEVFHRSLGETSDAVSKETYDFKDRGGDNLTLRPEGTAGVIRAFVSNGLAQNLPLKFYYSGPMFRYERPQKGRFRQFHQIGIEALGYDSPISDVEGIALAWQFLQELGLEKKVKLEINSLGDPESRKKYRQALLNFLTPQKSSLSTDSQLRLEKNPLRILDSKDENDKKIILHAPKMQDFMSDDSKKFFSDVLAGLKVLGISAYVNHSLVRGLDYYAHTVFEITTDLLGAQSTVIGGGRYEGLVELFGGASTSGFGWGAGIERLMLLASDYKVESKKIKLAVIPADEKNIQYCLQLTNELRKCGHISELIINGNVGKKLKRANKMEATHALIVGETEEQQNIVAVKNLSTGEQKNVLRPDVIQLKF